jgi:DNA-binding NarL/FixJ family response regulator
MKNIFIADDHPIFRKGLLEIISSENDFNIVGESSDGLAAIKIIIDKKPDVAVLDIQMPNMDGFEVQKKINELALDTKVIFLTMHKEEDIFEHAMEMGVKGYVLKESASEEIIICVNNVLQGKYYISGSISDYLFNWNNKIKEGLEKNDLSLLTSAEMKILKLISEKKSSREIAEILYVSVRTVENHRNNICTKLNMHGANSLLKYTLENKKLLV